MRAARPSVLALIAFITAALAPSFALACPYCAGSARNTSVTWGLLAGLMLLPYPVAYAVYRFIRSEERALAPHTTRERTTEQ